MVNWNWEEGGGHGLIFTIDTLTLGVMRSYLVICEGKCILEVVLNNILQCSILGREQ